MQHKKVAKFAQNFCKNTGEQIAFDLYKIILHNNDSTPSHFVVQVIQSIFDKKPSEAHAIMYHAHCYGSAAIGVFAKDIAIAYISTVNVIAKRHGYTLVCSNVPLK